MIASLVLLAALAGPADDVATLSKEVDTLKKAVADAASQRSVADLEARLERLSGELAQTRARNSSDEDVRRAIDSLQTQVAELERRVASLRVRGEDTASGFPAGAHASYDEGFSLRGNEEGLLLRFNAYAQIRYEGVNIEDARETANASDRSSFTLPRTRLEMTGNAFSPQLAYRILVDFTQSPVVQDAWAEWTPRPWLAVRAGRFKTPFSRQHLVAENRFQLTDRSDATDAFRPDRDIGVQLGTSAWDGRVHAQVAMQNGTRGLSNDNIDFAYAAHVAVDPLGTLNGRDEGDAEWSDKPLVSIGGSLLYNLLATDATKIGLSPDVDGDGKLDNVAMWEGGGELAARWRGASLQAELFYRDLDYGKAPATVNAGANVDRQTSWGWYAQAGYFVLPRRLELAARYGYSQPINFGLDPSLRAAVPAEHHEATFGLTYLIVGRSLKLQAEYSYLEDDNVPELHGISRSSNRVRAQLQVGF